MAKIKDIATQAQENGTESMDKAARELVLSTVLGRFARATNLIAENKKGNKSLAQSVLDMTYLDYGKDAYATVLYEWRGTQAGLVVLDRTPWRDVRDALLDLFMAEQDATPEAPQELPATE